MLCFAIGACAAAEEETVAGEANLTATLPVEGSCEGDAMVSLANDATREELAASVPARAADEIVAARPIASLSALDAVPQVGPSVLGKLFELAKAQGLTTACSQPSGGNPSEVGVISDLDDTVIPAADPDMSKAPFPGVRTLYDILEHHNGGKDGDVYYVTAREPKRVVEVPAYLAKHGVPAGPIETGTSGAPFIARPEKVRDMKKILARTGAQRFVFFGDTSHVDPDVQRDMLAAAPDRMIAGIIHKVTATVAEDRVKGLHVVENYAEAASVLLKLGVIDASEAKSVIENARSEGLSLTDARAAELLAP